MRGWRGMRGWPGPGHVSNPPHNPPKLFVAADTTVHMEINIGLYGNILIALRSEWPFIIIRLNMQ